jgi:formate/nitrite transporter FocA (FNT family)
MADTERKRKSQDNGEPPAAPELTPAERQMAHKRTALRPAVVHEAIREEGENELTRTFAALFWSALAAGLSMGFSMIAEGLLLAHLPDQPWRPLVSNLGYSVGFVIVVLGRQQLFTETTLTVILPLLARRDLQTLVSVLRFWTVVLVVNVLGTGLFAFLIAHTALFPPEVKTAFADIARHALSGTPELFFLRGVFAGWLIAMMVWLLPAAESARLWVIVLMTYLVGLGEFSHIVAGSIDALYGVAAGSASWADYGRYALPTLLGNIVGGVSLVAALNHAQVTAE